MDLGYQRDEIGDGSCIVLLRLPEDRMDGGWCTAPPCYSPCTKELKQALKSRAVCCGQWSKRLGVAKALQGAQLPAPEIGLLMPVSDLAESSSRKYAGQLVPSQPRMLCSLCRCDNQSRFAFPGPLCWQKAVGSTSGGRGQLEHGILLFLLRGRLGLPGGRRDGLRRMEMAVHERLTSHGEVDCDAYGGLANTLQNLEGESGGAS